jgi:site-specific recombinase XerD
MKTKDWDRAERRMLDLFDPASPVARRKLLSDAIAAFLADCGARHLKTPTVTSYQATLGALSQVCETAGAKHVDQVTVDALTRFRASRTGRDGESPMKPSSQRKELETVRVFLRFCLERDWITTNPAKVVKPPRESGPPTLPFEQADIDAILGACSKIENHNRASAERARKRARAMILLMLYSGLRIGDVAVLERSRIDATTRKLMVRTMKTGAPLYVKLPPSVLDSLAALPLESHKYFFWTGNGKATSLIGSLRRSIDCVLNLAGVKGHPHRFRDTFAVRLLEQGTPIRTVQLLLGHTSVQTTEKHYAPFVTSQQRLLDAATDRLDFESPAALGA